MDKALERFETVPGEEDVNVAGDALSTTLVQRQRTGNGVCDLLFVEHLRQLDERTVNVGIPHEEPRSVCCPRQNAFS